MWERRSQIPWNSSQGTLPGYIFMIRKVKHKKPSRQDKRNSLVNEIQTLRKACGDINTIIKCSADSLQVSDKYKYFSELPLSQKTKAGLDAAHFVEMTEIQKLTLPTTLAGRDILGAAETGSGKTLAFLVPVLERLYLEGWSANDGLGALILAPTRELAIQIFQVLRKIGSKHTISAGLIIGGKDLKTEREAIVRMNILVATPGRLLQHMDQAYGFEWNNLQVLVLDEADRILDLGFAKTVDAIVSSLPKTRQTILFSATQTSSVQNLARLSLRNPISLSTESLRSNNGSGSDAQDVPVLRTPQQLRQYFLVTSLADKIDHLWSFVRVHTNEKIMVFVSSCKQVRFIYESFCRLQPGVPVMHLHGKQKQPRRMTVYADFCRRKSALLICTDIAARGLDFPAVDWVVQVDCPEDVETYVHRVGRTARYSSSGNSILFLLPSERKMISLLRDENNLPIASFQGKGNENEVKPKNSVKSKLQALCSQSSELKYLAQKSIVSYVRSIFLNGNKSVFNVEGLPFDEFALAIGLAGAPKLRFIGKQSAAKNESRDAGKLQFDSSDSETSEVDSNTKRPARAIDRIFKKKNNDILSEHYAKMRDQVSSGEDSDEDDILRIKRTDAEINAEEFKTAPPTRMSRRDLLKTKKKYRLKNSEDRPIRMIFDEETGVGREKFPFEPEIEFDKTGIDLLADQYIKGNAESLANADVLDKQRLKLARKEKKLEKKRKNLTKDHIDGNDKSIRLGLDSDESSS